MDFVSMFQMWVSAYTFAFSLAPIGLCLTWHRRQSSDGFSAINLVFPLLVISCWLKYALLLNDFLMILLNGVAVVQFAVYLFVYDMYQSDKRALHYQLSTAIVVFISVYLHIHRLDDTQVAIKHMGTAAALLQIVSMAGIVYEMYRVVKLKTTEYLPASMTYGGLFLAVQWLYFGYLIDDFYISISNAAGVLLNVIMIVLYFIYPPLTWRVPLIGTGPQQKETKKDD